MEPMHKEEWKDVLAVGRMREAEVDGCSLVSRGLNICGLSPSSDTWGLAVLGGSGGLTINLYISRSCNL